MKKKNIRLLFSPGDREALAPVLEELRARGVQVSDGGEREEKGQVVLAALSERFYGDSAATRALLALIGAEAENVLPLQMDETPIPDEIKNALYSRNIIPAAGRDAGQLAERILAALPEKKNRLPLILTAAAVIVALLTGVIVWQSGKSEETALPAMADSEAADSVYIPEGVTEADLARIWDVVITGDRIEMFTAEDAHSFGYVTAGNGQITVNWPRYDWFASRSWEGDRAHYYSKEDSREYTMTVWEDLRFLALMPNLHHLSMAMVASEQLPDLTGADKLEQVELMDTAIGDLRWLEGSSLKTITVFNSNGSVTDFSPLTGCAGLENVVLDLVNTRTADLSGFAPPKLRSLYIKNGHSLQGTLDLSGLAGCKKLKECWLEYELPIRDISFLTGLKLNVLSLKELRSLQDISALRGMPSLTNLSVEYCPAIRDYTPIGGCSALKTLQLHTDDAPLRDASFLAGLRYLENIGLFGVALRDMDFLASVSGNGAVKLGFAGDIQDYSGLANIKHFSYLHVNPRGQYDNRGGDFAAVLPYIRDAVVDQLMLYSCRGVDLSALPTVRQELDICYGDLTDLTGLKAENLRRLELDNCLYLTALNGVEALGTFSGDPEKLELRVDNCPRLTDWTALAGARLRRLELCRAYTVPDLGTFRTSELWLENIADLTDVSFLDAVNADEPLDLALVGLEQVRDLSPVFRLHGGQLLVPPHLREQALELVERGNYEFYNVAYPEGDWDPLDEELELLSLEELNTLPKALLRRVRRLCVAGDRIFEWRDQEVHDRWERGKQIWYIRDRATGAETDIPRGTIADMSALSDLIGLQELELYCQPLSDLEGIQYLSSLESFFAVDCPELKDISPLFAVSGLREVQLKGIGATSLQGIQNLPLLTSLDLSDSAVRDLSPLAECDFSEAYEQGGVSLSLNGLDLLPDSFEALGTIKRYSSLAFNDQDPAVWMPALADTEILFFAAGGDLRSDADLAAFAADHPELRGIWLGGMDCITDLTCLLPLEELDYVGVTADMYAAIESLNGADYGFELEIDD